MLIGILKIITVGITLQLQKNSLFDVTRLTDCKWTQEGEQATHLQHKYYHISIPGWCNPWAQYEEQGWDCLNQDDRSQVSRGILVFYLHSFSDFENKSDWSLSFSHLKQT